MQQIQRPLAAGDYRDALGSIRWAKNVFLWLVMLALLVDVGLWVTVRFFKALDAGSGLQNAVYVIRSNAGEEAEAPKMPEPGSDEANLAERSNKFYQMLGWLLRALQAIGLICGVLLSVVLLTGMLVMLSGQLGGAGRITSAYIWSLLLLVILVPWDRIVPGLPLPGVLFGRPALVDATATVSWGACGVYWYDQVLYYARFAGYPVLAVLVWMRVQLRFGSAWRRATIAVVPPAQEIESQ